MIANNLMLPAKKLTTVSTKDTIKDAYDKINNEGFLSIPVVDDDTFKGTLSLRMVYEKAFEDGISKEDILKLKVEDVYDRAIQKVTRFEEIETAVSYLEIKNIPFVAVVDENNTFLGIITHKAVFSLVTSIYGLNKGKRISMLVQDVSGQISKIAKIVSEADGNILSFVIQDPKSKMSVREVIMRVDIEYVDNLVKKLKKSGFVVN